MLSICPIQWILRILPEFMDYLDILHGNIQLLSPIQLPIKAHINELISIIYEFSIFFSAQYYDALNAQLIAFKSIEILNNNERNLAFVSSRRSGIILTTLSTKIQIQLNIDMIFNYSVVFLNCAAHTT